MSAPETAKHFFGECTRWQHIRDTFPALVYLYSLMGNIWPPCYLHCGWIIEDLFYGFDLLDESTTTYYISRFSQQTHSISFNVFADFTLPLPDQPGLSFGASNSSSAKFFSFVC